MPRAVSAVDGAGDFGVLHLNLALHDAIADPQLGRTGHVGFQGAFYQALDALHGALQADAGTNYQHTHPDPTASGS